MSDSALEPTSEAPPGTVRELLHVAMPLVLSAGSLSLMNVIDRMLLTWHSESALAAATPAAMLHWTVMSLALGIAMYVNTFVAQYEGAGRRDRVSASLWQGLYLALVAGTAMLAFIPFAPMIFALVGHEPQVRELEVAYFTTLCAGSIPFMLSAVMSCFYSGRGKSRVVLWVNVAAVLINALLDAYLIFGLGPFPELGIVGAGIATVLAKTVCLVVFTVVLLATADGKRYGFWRNRGFDSGLFRRLIRHGLPNGMQFLGDIAGFALFLFLVGRLGQLELAATNMSFTINQLAFVPMLGFGTAVATLVGKRIGEGRPELAVRTTWVAFGLSGIYMLVFTSFFVLFPDVVISPFIDHSSAGSTEGQTLRDLVAVLLRFVAVFAVFDAMAIVFGSAVRGAGDTRFSLVLVLLSAWLVMVLPTVVMTFTSGGNLLGSWAACTAYIVVVGSGFLWRFQAGHWKRMRVIESKEELIGETVDIPADQVPEILEPVIDERPMPSPAPEPAVGG